MYKRFETILLNKLSSLFPQNGYGNNLYRARLKAAEIKIYNATRIRENIIYREVT